MNPNTGSSTGMAALVQQARADLAARLAIPPDAITVKSEQEVEWPDSSLGCPKPGMMYAQMITPGVLIVLEANGKTYEYHGSRVRVSLCEK